MGFIPHSQACITVEYNIAEAFKEEVVGWLAGRLFITIPFFLPLLSWFVCSSIRHPPPFITGNEFMPASQPDLRTLALPTLYCIDPGFT
jgi:hypothetical protein